MNENKRLREVRKALGLTAVALAKEISVKDYKIRDIENGHQKVSIEIVFKLEEVFNVNMRWLLFGKDEMFINSNQNKKTMLVEPKATNEENIKNNIVNGVNNGYKGDIHINKKDFGNNTEQVEKLISLLKYAPPIFMANIINKLEEVKKSCEI